MIEPAVVLFCFFVIYVFHASHAPNRQFCNFRKNEEVERMLREAVFNLLSRAARDKNPLPVIVCEVHVSD